MAVMIPILLLFCPSAFITDRNLHDRDNIRNADVSTANMKPDFLSERLLKLTKLKLPKKPVKRFVFLCICI